MLFYKYFRWNLICLVLYIFFNCWIIKENMFPMRVDYCVEFFSLWYGFHLWLTLSTGPQHCVQRTGYWTGWWLETYFRDQDERLCFLSGVPVQRAARQLNHARGIHPHDQGHHQCNGQGGRRGQLGPTGRHHQHGQPEPQGHHRHVDHVQGTGRWHYHTTAAVGMHDIALLFYHMFACD